MLDKIDADILFKLTTLNKLFVKHGFQLRLVGGCVRDLLMGKIPHDFDLATDATPNEMFEVANQEGLRVIETGLSHGTLTFVLLGDMFEVTTLRIDTDCDGRHAQIEYIKDWLQDALRRDFTINAMSLDFNDNLYDYFGGQDDIKNHVIRFVGNPADRIREDYLRVFRFFRFISKFEGRVDLDNEALDILEQDWVIQGIKTLSVERIWVELKNMLQSYCSWGIFWRIYDNTIILETIGIQVTPAVWANFTLACKIKVSPMARLATLFDSKSKVSAEQFGRNMKMSLVEINELTFISKMLNEHLDLYGLKRLIANNQPRAWVQDIASILGMLDEIKEFNPCKFPILGRDLVALGISPGPGLGDILGKLHTLWVDSIIDGISLSKEDLLKMLYPIPGSNILYPLPIKEI